MPQNAVLMPSIPFRWDQSFLDDSCEESKETHRLKVLNMNNKNKSKPTLTVNTSVGDSPKIEDNCVPSLPISEWDPKKKSLQSCMNILNSCKDNSKDNLARERNCLSTVVKKAAYATVDSTPPSPIPKSPSLCVDNSPRTASLPSSPFRCSSNRTPPPYENIPCVTPSIIQTAADSGEHDATLEGISGKAADCEGCGAPDSGLSSSESDQVCRTSLFPDHISDTSSVSLWESGTDSSVSYTNTRNDLSPHSVSPLPPSFTHEDSSGNLALCRQRLSSCSFYLGTMSKVEAKSCLAHLPLGTFLLRDSADSKFVYSISVQTHHGPVSIRIGYKTGEFYLDYEPHQMHIVPKFSCVLELIKYYMRANRRTESKLSMNSIHKRDNSVLLLQPYRHQVVTLRHMCRTSINRLLEGRSVDRLVLIPSLKSYISEYPYDL